MDLTHLSISGLYAVKSEAKEKEAYYRNIKKELPEHESDYQFYADLLYHADKELVERLSNLK